MKEESSSLQEAANAMHNQICDQAYANFPMKISGSNVVTFYDAVGYMTKKSYFVHCFSCPGIMNAMVPLTIALASHEANSIAWCQMTENVMLQLIWIILT